MAFYEVSIDVKKESCILDDESLNNCVSFINTCILISFLSQTLKGDGIDFVYYLFSDPIMFMFLFFSSMVFVRQLSHSEFTLDINAPKLTKDIDIPKWVNSKPYDLVTETEIDFKNDHFFFIMFRASHQALSRFDDVNLKKKLLLGHYDMISRHTYQQLVKKCHPLTQQPLVLNQNLYAVISKGEGVYRLVSSNLPLSYLNN